MTTRTSPHCLLIAVCAKGELPKSQAMAQPIWWRLANPGLVNQRIKATLVFAGQGQGAIIGKAMSSLKAGRGLVLVLADLQ